MALRNRFDDFMDGLADGGRAVLDRAEEGFDRLTDGIEDRLDGVGERFEGVGRNIVDRRGERVERRQEFIEEGGIGGRVREVGDRVADAVGEVIDPVRDAARVVVNTASNVAEAVTGGALSFQSVEGEGFSADVNLLGREFGVELDLDRSDGDLGIGASADAVLADFDAGVNRSVDEATGTVRREAQVGGGVLGVEGDVGVAVTTGNTAAGQRGIDLAAFAETVNADGDLVTKEAGITANLDSSLGQAGLDLGVFGQTTDDGVTTRDELVATLNTDASESQAGRDKGVAREQFVDGVETRRDEFVQTTDAGFSDGQLEGDLGFAREQTIGENSTRDEVGAFLGVGGEDGLVESRSGVFVEREVDGVEVSRVQIAQVSRFGVDDDRLIQPGGVVLGRDSFDNGEETFSTRVGAEFSLGFTEKGAASSSLDFLREIELDDVEIVDDREAAFFVSTDLTDPENIENIALLAGLPGIPSEAIASFFEGDLKGAAAGLTELDADSFKVDSAAAESGIIKKVAEKGLDFFAGTAEDRQRTSAAFSEDAARALLAEQLAAEAADDDDFGVGAAAPTVPESGTVLRAAPSPPIETDPPSSITESPIGEPPIEQAAFAEPEFVPDDDPDPFGLDD